MSTARPLPQPQTAGPAWQRQPAAVAAGCASAATASCEVSSGKVEIGQGIVTALAQIVADELDVDLARVRMVRGQHGRAAPTRASTSGSLSVQHSGSALRHACAEARAIYLRPPPQRLGVARREPRGRATAPSSGPGNLRTSYWELADDALLARDATPGVRAQGRRQRGASPGTPAARLDIPDKVFGRPRFIHDLALPGMLHGRVLRPPSPGAKLHVARRRRPRAAMPGVVAVVRDGSFVGVVAETEAAARGGARAPCARARPGATATRCPTRPTSPPGSRASRSRPPPSTSARPPAPAHAPARCAAQYYAALHRPRVDGAVLRHRAVDRRRRCTSGRTARASTTCAPIWRSSLALPPEQHRRRARRGRRLLRPQRRRRRGASMRCCWRAPPTGRPVRLQWSREDELAWAPFGAAHGHRHRGRPRRGAARSSAGATTCGATATSRGPAARKIADAAGRLAARQAVRAPDRHQPAAGRRRRRGAQRGAALRLPGLAHHQPPPARPCRSAPRRCARSAPSPTCSPSNRSSTSWRPSAARIRWPSACAT